jgi:16S rRNA (guanine966-N2)-methyltransferase
MRVIAGAARRTLLAAPVGMATRPTSDRAKEGLFNIIGPRIVGARFLDLFCGSGAIGIEALSRGASEAVFVDSAKPALAAAAKNLTAAKLAHKAEILDLPAAEAINRLSEKGSIFDIIFLDPPYEGDWLGVTFQVLAKSSILEKDGLLITETQADAPAPQADMFVPERRRDYGRTRFLFYRKAAIPPLGFTLIEGENA